MHGLTGTPCSFARTTSKPSHVRVLCIVCVYQVWYTCRLVDGAVDELDDGGDDDENDELLEEDDDDEVSTDPRGV